MASDHPVILFDGVCNFCNASINYIIDHDPACRFRFAPLQSAAGAELAREHHIDTGKLESIVLIEDGRAYQRSTAALRIARQLAGPVRVLGVFRVVPAVLRDPVYNFIARHRYRLCGKADACRLPTPQDRARFLH